MENFENSDFSGEYLESLLQGDRKKCSAIAHRFLAEKPSVLDLYEQVFKVSLYEIGRLWETNQISVAAEHLATAITEGILNELFEQLISSGKMNRKVVVACVEQERHQVGVKMVADTFEMMGWESYFLGTGIPVQELIRYIHEVKPDILAISLSIYFNYASLLKMIEKLRLEFPELQILIGGQAFSHLSEEAFSKFSHILLIPDLYLLKKYIGVLNSNLN